MIYKLDIQTYYYNDLFSNNFCNLVLIQNIIIAETWNTTQLLK